MIATLGKILAVAGFVGLLWAPAPAGLSPEAQRLAAVTFLMAVLWVSQAIPIAATSLIPLVAFPFLGIQTADVVSTAYMNKNIFLFMGGFIIALGIEKWGLHRRIALHIVRWLGTSLRRVILGFMVATAFLSMWISNTASTLLMLPIGLAMLTSLRELVRDATSDDLELRSSGRIDKTMDRFSVVLMLGIAYAASIGGFTTLVGTPTNVQFLQIWSDRFPDAPEISAGEWMVATVPVGIVILIVCWGSLALRIPRLPGMAALDRRFFSDKLHSLGRPSRAERWMMAVFLTTALLWIFRKPLRIGHESLLPGWGDWVEACLISHGATKSLAAKAVHDSTVAIGMSLLMFLIPAARNEKGETQYLMDWKTAERLPWGILLLFGGGFALAGAFNDSGLAQWVGDRFAATVMDWPLWALVMAVCLLLMCLTEFTSNVATVSAILPILAGTAVSLGIDPMLIAIPATISTSCAFMLPIATPPNAIVFGSGHIRMGQMVRYGVVLNLMSAIVITAATFFVFVPQLGISLDAIPDWAMK